MSLETILSISPCTCMSNKMLVSEHNKLFGTTKTTKSEKKVKRKQSNMTTKKTTKKFQLVSKYANYPTWDEKQNAPFYYKIVIKIEMIDYKITL